MSRTCSARGQSVDRRLLSLSRLPVAAAAPPVPTPPIDKATYVPPQAELMAPGPLGERALGKPDAPITVIEYVSLTCPHCANFHRSVFPQVKKAFIDTGKVRFIVREFPIGRTSGNAAIANRCAPEDKYFFLLGQFLTRQPEWVSQDVRPDAIYAVAKAERHDARDV